MTDLPKSDYNEYPKTLDRDDVWGQVRRTINGRRISDGEVATIVASISDGLNLAREDVMLDLACGNGALTERLFASCRAVLGVDASTYLIDVAREKFENAPAYTFRESDIVGYLREEPDPLRFTKVLCYASIQFLTRDYFAAMLTEISSRFANAELVMLGNVPDRERADMFLRDNPHITDLSLDDPVAQAGVWWAQEDLKRLAADCGWFECKFNRLPPDVFNARYRYDAVLSRRVKPAADS